MNNSVYPEGHPRTALVLRLSLLVAVLTAVAGCASVPIPHGWHWFIRGEDFIATRDHTGKG